LVTTNLPLSPWHESDDDRWATLNADVRRGTDEYYEMLTALRLLQDRVAGSTPPPDVAGRITTQLRELSDQLDAHQADEAGRWDGWHGELPGRGMPVLPPYLIDDDGGTKLRGTVTFGRFFLGGNGVAHGGSQPLLFDDVFGRIANHGYPGVARTAYLKVNYRRITPLDTELTFDARRDKVEGRKRWVTGRLYTPDGDIASDAEGLFLHLLPGQA
jgi:acyl-coenzyme A thioesterase PaaI-like protein